MTAKGKRTFWVTSDLSPVHQERVTLLNQNGFDVLLMSCLQDVLNHTAEQRPVCVFIDTPVNGAKSGAHLLQTVSAMPELNGVKFVLIVTHSAPDVLQIAVSENFRDIVPLSMPAQEWLHRIQFATATKRTEYPSPYCEISLNQPSVLRAPARIIWINETHIRIECRGNQRVGNSIMVSGPIADAFGVPHISLTVESVHKENLLYRFSQALV